MSKKIKVGISVGDLNGVGVEVILKTFLESSMYEYCTPIVFGSFRTLQAYQKVIGLNISMHEITDLERAVQSKLNVVNVWKEEVALQLGTPTKNSGAYALKSLNNAVEALKNKHVDVLVTAPIDKENIQSDEFQFHGHTEFLESKLKGKSLMVLMNEVIKVGLVTGHIPITKVSESITPELITSKVNILHEMLLKDFALPKGRIAVLGLNPHAGDNGLIGSEDDEIIKPTIEKIRDKGKCLVFGPYAADGFFGSRTFQQFDAVLAMYHDQGLVGFKTLAFGNGVNFTAGLDKIRTSPDHGTAFAIAGKREANPNSFREAVFTALQLYQTRSEYENLTSSILQVRKDHKLKDNK